MSMYLEFEPHSWYMGFAIEDNRKNHWAKIGKEDKWNAYTDNGNTYMVDTCGGATLAELKQQIRQYHIRHKNGYGERLTKRLETTA